jgi:hypothetical protein
MRCGNCLYISIYIKPSHSTIPWKRQLTSPGQDNEGQTVEAAIDYTRKSI